MTIIQSFDMRSLPTELQCLSISFLDPATLVSLSQADTYFRQLIQPRRGEMVERLLQLECEPQHGGPLVDDLSSSSWNGDDSMRWACTDCLRLLPHSSFDNHSLLRAGYRKPAAGSQAATAPVTSWGSPRTLWGRRFQGKKQAKTQADGDDVGSSGLKRHLRRCNECRFARGELGKAGSRERGVPSVPIQPSRGLVLASSRDRYFPGLAAHVGLGALEGAAVAHRRQFWPTRMVRCPGCTTWQEMGAFRLGTQNARWAPIHAGDATDDAEGEGFCAWNWDDVKLTREAVEGLRCNACFAGQHGADALARVLSRWARRLMRSEVSSAEFALFGGWETVRSQLKHVPSQDHQARLEAVLARHEPSIPGPINQTTLPVYRAAHDELRDAWDEMAADTKEMPAGLGGPEFEQWLHRYDAYEARWELVTKLHAVVVRQPEVLAEWALN